MEFTYEGLVRWGFGFHNPNHAAAAICAVLPFVWGFGRAGARPSPWVSVARWLLTGGLLAALARKWRPETFFIFLHLPPCAASGDLIHYVPVRPHGGGRRARRGASDL